MKQAVAEVALRPAKPLMIYDGDCNFCKFWVIRWQRSTGARVEYLRSQDPLVAGRFPELPPGRLDNSVQFIETDGRVYSGAQAVFRSLGYTWIRGWPLWLYQKVPGVEAVAEWGYRFVARHRTGFSRVTRLIWRGEFPD